MIDPEIHKSKGRISGRIGRFQTKKDKFQDKLIFMTFIRE